MKKIKRPRVRWGFSFTFGAFFVLGVARSHSREWPPSFLCGLELLKLFRFFSVFFF